jgi:hypothetical protein
MWPKSVIADDDDDDDDAELFVLYQSFFISQLMHN